MEHGELLTEDKKRIVTENLDVGNQHFMKGDQELGIKIGAIQKFGLGS